MPLSLRLALLVAAGAAAGLFGPADSTRLLASITAAAAAGAWLASTHRIVGARTVLVAASVAGLAAWRSAEMVAGVTRPPLVRWYETQTNGTPEGEARVRDMVIRLRGRLLGDAAATEYGAQLPLAVTHVQVNGQWMPCRGGVAISVSGGMLDRLGDWRAGRTLTLPVALRAPTRYRNAGLADQARALAFRGTPLVASAKSGALVEVERAGRWWDEWAAAVRGRVRAAMRAHVAPHDRVSAAIGTAILIGDRAALPLEVEQRLQEAGTYHVVAISGGNIALLAAAVLGVLWSVGIRFAPASAAAAVVLVSHAWIIGGGSSVVRATVTAVIYLALRLIDQRTAPVHAVAVAAAGLIAADPLEIAGAGLWLTFGATAALLMAARRWSWGGRAGGWTPIVTVTMASIAVELVLTPISAFVFERVTLAGLVLNLAAVPAMALVQGAASLCALADAAGIAGLARLAGFSTHLAARVLVDSSGLVNLVPWATWRVPPPSPAALAAYYLLVAGWWRASRPPLDTSGRRRARRGFTLMVLGVWLWIAAAPWSWLPPSAGGLLRVTAMDVGQGDAFLITAPDGQTVMVDAGGIGAGGSFDIGDRVLGPALRARGLRRLDYLAITHGDQDHLGGARALIEQFRPHEIWAGVPVNGHVPVERLRLGARALGLSWRWLQRGDRLELGGVELRVHHPPLPDWERQRVRNDDSAVIEVRHGDVSVWLTGDISRTIEQELTASLDERGRIVILKAAHHGSVTSSDPAWVRRLRPVVVLVSAGRGNLFGHPAPVVLDRYSRAGAEIFRTDRDGQIELVTNGTYVDVSTFTGRRWRLR